MTPGKTNPILAVALPTVALLTIALLAGCQSGGGARPGGSNDPYRGMTEEQRQQAITDEVPNATE